MKRNTPRVNNPARLARLRDQAIKLRERVKRSTLAFLERSQARFNWWQRAFRVPMVADWAIFTKAKTLLSAFMALQGLASSKKSSLVALMVEGSAPQASRLQPRSSDIRGSGKPAMRNTSRNIRRLYAEGLEQRQLLATDVSVIGNDLVIEDLTGSNNLLSLSRSGANLVLSDANEPFATGIAGAVLSNGNKTVTVPASSLGVAGKIIVKTLGGSNSLSVDVSTDLGFNVDYQGGSGTSDSLTLVADTVTSVTHTFTNANDGSITIVDGGSRVITYTGLEPITDNLIATDRVFTFNGGAETITLTDATGANMTIDSTLSESVTFANPSVDCREHHECSNLRHKRIQCRLVRGDLRQRQSQQDRHRHADPVWIESLHWRDGRQQRHAGDQWFRDERRHGHHSRRIKRFGNGDGQCFGCFLSG